MKREDIIAAFETEFQDPGAIKSGEYLEEHVLDVAKNIINKNRSGLVEVMREWIGLREEPKTMLAVTVAGNLVLAELREDIIILRGDIEQHKCFMPWYVRLIDNALSRINKPIIPLSKKWAPILLAQDETGMGYQIVTVTLQDGRKFDQVVIDSGYITLVRGYKDIPFKESDITDIKVTHDKWDWNSER